jgi:hypothetical protein
VKEWLERGVGKGNIIPRCIYKRRVSTDEMFCLPLVRSMVSLPSVSRNNQAQNTSVFQSDIEIFDNEFPFKDVYAVASVTDTGTSVPLAPSLAPSLTPQPNSTQILGLSKAGVVGNTVDILLQTSGGAQNKTYKFSKIPGKEKEFSIPDDVRTESARLKSSESRPRTRKANENEALVVSRARSLVQSIVKATLLGVQNRAFSSYYVLLPMPRSNDPTVIEMRALVTRCTVDSSTETFFHAYFSEALSFWPCIQHAGCRMPVSPHLGSSRYELYGGRDLYGTQPRPAVVDIESATGKKFIVFPRGAILIPCTNLKGENSTFVNLHNYRAYLEKNITHSNGCHLQLKKTDFTNESWLQTRMSIVEEKLTNIIRSFITNESYGPRICNLIRKPFPLCVEHNGRYESGQAMAKWSDMTYQYYGRNYGDPALHTETIEGNSLITLPEGVEFTDPDKEEAQRIDSISEEAGALARMVSTEQQDGYGRLDSNTIPASMRNPDKLKDISKLMI